MEHTQPGIWEETLASVLAGTHCCEHSCKCMLSSLTHSWFPREETASNKPHTWIPRMPNLGQIRESFFPQLDLSVDPGLL